MAILSPTNLETANYGTVGWNAIYSSNFQKINDYFNRFNWSIATITYSSSITVDWNTSDVQIVTLSGNATINFSNPRSGGKYVLLIKQDATGGRTVTWGSNIVCNMQPNPTANSITAFFFVYDSTNTKYICPQQEVFNADTLDNQHGSYYLDRTNHSGTQAPSTISPQGSGSGLDADKVDGYHASQTPAPNTIPVAGANGKIDSGWIDVSTQSMSNADTVDNYHASQTPAPNVIVPLNANGVLDLSATYVRSSVYTFRRVDLTNATSDYMLQVGEEAYKSFSNTTSVPLRIATQSGTYYECHVVCSNTGGTSGGTAAAVYLNPNNTTYNNSFAYVELYRNSNAASSGSETYSAFRCGAAFVSSVFYITNFVQYKNVKGIYDTYGISNSYPLLFIFSTDWRDTTTPWTSLGTIVFSQDSSGYIIVRRLV